MISSISSSVATLRVLTALRKFSQLSFHPNLTTMDSQEYIAAKGKHPDSRGDIFPNEAACKDWMFQNAHVFEQLMPLLE